MPRSNKKGCEDKETSQHSVECLLSKSLGRDQTHSTLAAETVLRQGNAGMFVYKNMKLQGSRTAYQWLARQRTTNLSFRAAHIAVHTPLTIQPTVAEHSCEKGGKLLRCTDWISDLNIPEIDWEQSGDVSELHHGVNVPQFESPLNPEQLRILKEHIDPLQASQNNGVDIYLETLAYVENLVENQ
ncbi:hypothetical protein D9C73_001258 [Collichthys lucidus]|uniref:Uncharacterized protein n=1 Tax=Collichthys lucidus TaxID=240159 RepID=A0A4U5U165_COLLU|nr:hypothetical protein D9C73_001258 [Collichthys lucidus]